MKRYFGGEEDSREMTEKVDKGSTFYLVILSVMTLVAAGLVVQVIMQIVKNPGANFVLRSCAIFLYISMIAGAWVARSKGKTTIALSLALAPAVISCLFNFIDTGVIQVSPTV
jgi:hypothetical protein